MPAQRICVTDQATAGHIRSFCHRRHTHLETASWVWASLQVVYPRRYCRRRQYIRNSLGWYRTDHHDWAKLPAALALLALPDQNAVGYMQRRRMPHLAKIPDTGPCLERALPRPEDDAHTGYPYQANCPRKRTSFSKNIRKSPIPYLSMAIRSTPSPNAKPLTSSG